MYLILLLVLLVPAGPSATQACASRAGGAWPAPDYEAALTDLLQDLVTEDGRVRYDRLRGPLRGAFRRVLRAVETFDPAALQTQEEKLAFWMNAYNVQMLQHLLETPGLRDILEGGRADLFFRTPYPTAGRCLTLDQIEHVILRRQDGPAAAARLRVAHLDPRIHVGLNCAAASCPRLRRRAFTADRVDAMLEEAMRDFADDPAHLRVEGDGFVLSSLLDWFGEDFDAASLPAGDFLLRYMSPERPGYAALRDLLQGRAAAEIEAQPGVRFAYSWAVNRAD